jgi:hypothetical protein
MNVKANEVPRLPSLAKALMHAAERAPKINKGGKTKAVRLLTDAEKIAVRREYAKGYTIAGLKAKYRVSDGQIRNCLP